MEQNTRASLVLSSIPLVMVHFFHSVLDDQRAPFLSFVPSFHFDHVPKVLYPLTWWETDEKRVRERNRFQLWETESKCPDDSRREFWLHCAGRKGNVGLNPTQNPKIKETLSFFSPFPPCSWANWDHASLRYANRMWALKWSGLPHGVIISSLVFSAKEWFQGCMRLLCATEPHPRASVTSQPSTPPPLYYLSFRTWVTAMGALISCRILHILCVCGYGYHSPSIECESGMAFIKSPMRVNFTGH